LAKDESAFARIILPKSNNYKHYDVVAISYDRVLTESGELTPIGTFIEQLPKVQQPLLFITRHSAKLLYLLNERYKNDPTWNWGITIKERDMLMHDSPVPGAFMKMESTVVDTFGWKSGVINHRAIDPVVFYGREFYEIWKRTDNPVVRDLLLFGIELRNWCRANNLGIRSTSGGISSQFLRQERFYPESRRKVSRYINQRARENLPGNYYRLFVPIDPDREYQAYYLDQHAAHHYHAERTLFPNANSLYAHGRFKNIDLGSVVFPTTWPEFSGLYRLRLRIPQNATVHEFSPFTHKLWEESFDEFIWSSEIQFIKDLGYQIDGVIAAWGSIEKDEGIPKFAKWAQGELEDYSNASWLKPILLSTYGVLAMKPRQREIIRKQSKSKQAQPASTFICGKEIHGLLVGATGKDKKIEPSIVNVLQRGLIEAATRAESLGYAHYLTSKGYKVLHIYADGVIIEDEGNTSLPFLPEPWRLQNHLHHYKPINVQAFISSEIDKLPGGIHAYSGMELRPFFKSHRNRPYFTPEEIQWKRMYG